MLFFHRDARNNYSKGCQTSESGYLESFLLVKGDGNCPQLHPQNLPLGHQLGFFWATHLRLIVLPVN